MARIFYVADDDGDTNLSRRNATYVRDVDKVFEATSVQIACYDADGDLVTPDSGRIVISGSLIDGQWHTPSNGNGEIQLNTAGPNASYVTPLIEGPLTRIRAVVSGVADADVDHIVICIAQWGGE